LGHPASRVHQALQDMPFALRALAGLAMGLTAIAIIRSPWGQRSGAHMNPAVTLTFFALGKIAAWDALFYVMFQFIGGVSGVALAGALIGPPLRNSNVNYVVTAPGPDGPWTAWIAEFVISTLMMSTVLYVSNSRQWSRYTPFFAGALVSTFIAFESPLSGMSMNPARTFGSAYWARDWMALWIYFTAPVLAMLLAGLLYRFRHGVHAVFCAKLDHCNNQRCIFNCRFGELNAQ